MSPNPFHPKIENNNGLYDSPSSPPSPFKINKESYTIKKSSSLPSSSSSTCLARNTWPPLKPHQHHRPLIIYTHSPKIIHTHPRDFRALVQKLTGCMQFEDDPPPQSDVNNNGSSGGDDNNNNNTNNNEDDDSMNSVVTDENGSCLSDPTVNSCCMPPPMFDHHYSSSPCFNNLPFFPPDTSNFMCSTKNVTKSSSYPGYVDPLYFMPSTIRRSMSSSSSLAGLKDYSDI